MAQLLRAPVCLVENQSLVPRHLCHLEGSQPLVTLVPGNPMPSCGLFGHLHIGGRQSLSVGVDYLLWCL